MVGILVLPLSLLAFTLLVEENSALLTVSTAFLGHNEPILYCTRSGTLLVCERA